MSEAAFRAFNGAYGIGAELLYAACLTLFLRPFLRSRGRRWRMALIFVFHLLSVLFSLHPGIPSGTSGLVLTAMLTAASAVLGLERPTAFLLAIFYWNARTSSGLIAESPYFLLDSLRPAPNQPPEAAYLRAAVLVTLFLLVNIVLMAVMLYALQRQIRKRKLPLHGWELCYLSLIPAAGILFGQIVSRLWLEFEDGAFLLLYERHPAFLAVVPVLALLFYGGAYLAVVFQQRIAALQEEQATYFMERQQTQAIRARIHEAEQFYARIRQLKHEMRGHMTNIKGLAQSGEYDSLDGYIAKMDESMSGFELTLQTGNPVTDVIVNDTRRRCLDLGIRFQAKLHYPDPGAYDAFDMGIILQNLLQTAVEACGKVSE
ncbi:MAG: ATP-binding protein, partial [Oscillospiraceae bacterium]|nr:ATP-binding protein [Oscillospiraceae bacterium]